MNCLIEILQFEPILLGHWSFVWLGTGVGSALKIGCLRHLAIDPSESHGLAHS